MYIPSLSWLYYKNEATIFVIIKFFSLMKAVDVLQSDVKRPLLTYQLRLGMPTNRGDRDVVVETSCHGMLVLWSCNDFYCVGRLRGGRLRPWSQVGDLFNQWVCIRTCKDTQHSTAWRKQPDNYCLSTASYAHLLLVHNYCPSITGLPVATWVWSSAGMTGGHSTVVAWLTIRGKKWEKHFVTNY